MAFYLLTGRRVFEADNPMRLLVKHIEEKPAAPSSKTDALLGVEHEVEGWDDSRAADWWKARV